MSIERLFKIFFSNEAGEQIQRIKQITFTNGVRAEDDSKLPQAHFNIFK
jgi:hypothetical protein